MKGNKKKEERSDIRAKNPSPRRMIDQDEVHRAGQAFCPECQSVYYLKSWHNNPKRYEELSQDVKNALQCPACKKIQNNTPEGILTLSNIDNPEQEEQILSLVKNASERATRRDPQERVMKISKQGSEIEIYTTENQLAAGLGREIKRAFRGDLNIDFSHRDKLARVVWIAPPMVS